MARIRHGLSLIEVLLVIGILALMIGLLLPAIQQAREVALRLKCKNNVKQFSMAVTMYTDARDGTLPSIDGNIRPSPGHPNAILIDPNPHQAATFIFYTPPTDYVYSWVSAYLCPADPTTAKEVALPEDERGHPTSYTVNAQVFLSRRKYPNSIPDGVSNTLFYAERYSRCHLDGVTWMGTDPKFRPTFADGGSLLNGANSGQVYPVFSATTGYSEPSRPGVTFQVRPLWWEPPWGSPDLIDFLKNPLVGFCDNNQPQTPHPGGMVVGLGDGSVRTVRPRIAPHIFWSLVTPAGGEVVGDW